MLTFLQFISDAMVPGVSPGIHTEDSFFSQVKKTLDELSSIDIVCYTASKQKVYKDIVDILNTSKDTKNLKKSDIILVDRMGKQYSISIKNDKSDYWQSADTYLGKQARQIIDDCVSSKRCSLTVHDGIYKLEPCVAMKLSRAQMKDVMFGSDILPDGCVLCRTFTDDDFSIVNSKLYINCSEIITSVKDVLGTQYEPWLFIRSEQGRYSKDIGLRGLRVLAAYKRRIQSQSVLKL